MIENLISEYKLQIVCKGENVLLTKEFDTLACYSDNEIITEMLTTAHDELCKKDIYTIILWKLK